MNKKEFYPYPSSIEVSVMDGRRVLKKFIATGKEARSLYFLYQLKRGLTRAQALEKYFVLSLTQHVHTMRHEWELEILTERIQPTRYARYHLVSNIRIRALKGGRK